MLYSIWNVLLLQAVLATSCLALLAFPGAEGELSYLFPICIPTLANKTM
jgi:hypothetical protein